MKEDEVNELKEIIRKEIMRGLGDFLYRPITETNKSSMVAVVTSALRQLSESGYITDVPEIHAIQSDSDPTSITLYYTDKYGNIRPLDDWVEETSIRCLSVKITQDSS